MCRTRNNIIIYVLTTVILLLMLSSCDYMTRRSQSKANTIDSISVFLSDTTVSYYSSFEEPNCKLHFDFDIPVKASSKNTLKAAELMIISLTNDKDVKKTSSIENMIKLYTRSYILNYLKEGNSTTTIQEEENEENLDWMNYEEKCVGKVLYNNNNIFSYSVRTSSFAGGAHETTTNNGASLDLRTNEIYTLDYLFGKENIDSLKVLIVDKLNENNQLLTDDVDVIHNFYLSEDGITFVYGPLDIASYSDGEITVTLEWESVKPFLVHNPLQEN